MKYILIIFIVLSSCGKAYFPIELKTKDRSSRADKQQQINVNLIPITDVTLKKANKVEYRQRVILSGDLKKPAKLVDKDLALIEKLPLINDPGPYLVGKGDIIQFITTNLQDGSVQSFDSVVAEDGFANFYNLGRIKVEDYSQSRLEDIIYDRLIEKDIPENFQIIITGFNSKRVFISGLGVTPSVIPYTNRPLFIEEVISLAGLSQTSSMDTKIDIIRDKSKYTFSFINTISKSSFKYRIFPDDKIIFTPLNYRPETVLLVGETGAQRSISINSLERPTLSDTIFNGSVLNAVTSDFSQIYVIRSNDSKFDAFHLDISNPVRISLASKFEMRPDDIVFVATQPLSLYSRTLSQILGSAGLTIQARDTIRNEVNN